MVENIATNVSKKLTQATEFNDLVGMRAHMENMRQLLCLHLDEVRIIGIWGLPGTGKSTVTRLLFNQLSQRFDVSLYIKDIKALYTRPACYDADFMSLLTDQHGNQVLNLGVERERLKHKKVLVVIDNVDMSVQLDAMMKESQWFGPGSRVVIAVQDRNVLEAHRIGYIYRVALPPDYEAFQIFCMAAFGQKFPKEGFEDLARKVCDIAGRLPLRLKVMGSYFRGMSKQEWIDLIDPF